MNFCIAGTSIDSLAKLTGNEQKGVKATVFDLRINLLTMTDRISDQ